LDHSAETLDLVRKFGVKAYYGDASRPELLEVAGIKEAKAIVVAIDDEMRSIHIVEQAKKENPKIKVIARASSRTHVYRLYKAGADHIVRETFDSAMRAGRKTLEALGEHPFEVEKLSTDFTIFDRYTLKELSKLWDPNIPISENTQYLAKARFYLEQEAAAISGKQSPLHDRSDRVWIPKSRAKELAE